MDRWYIQVTESGLSPYREAHGPFDSPSEAGKYIEKLILDLKKILGENFWNDLTLYAFVIVFGDEVAVMDETEHQEILKPEWTSGTD